MSDTVDLCNQLGRMVRTADPVERRAFARELDRFWEQFPTFHERVVSGEAPGLFHFLIGALDAACREKAKTKPQLRVIRFPSKPDMGAASP